MAPKIKLYYFNFAAFGEVIRYILHYGYVEFEDIRYDSLDEFAKVKERFPFGKVPAMEVDGKLIYQTKSMCRHFSRKVGLVGKNEWEELEVDIMVETIDDFRAAMASFNYEKHEEAKTLKRKEVMSTQVPTYLDKFEEQLAKNGGHFVNGQVTWADFYFCAMVDYFKHMGGADLLDGRTNLHALTNKINNLPQIKQYLATRPPTMKI